MEAHSHDKLDYKGERVAKEPDVVRIKREKRERQVNPAPASLTRRRFLTFLGAGSAALAAGSAGVPTGVPANGSGGGEGVEILGPAEAQAGQSSGGAGLPFAPIEPSGADDVVLPEGFKYHIVRRWGDPVTGSEDYGYNNDFVAYFPIDALEGGGNSTDGILYVGHEYPDPKWVSQYEDAERETEKTPEQIAQEKAVVGGSIFRVRREGETWSFVESDEYNRRIDATTSMVMTGPAAGADEVQGANEVIGTLANCGGGVTPWNTVLTCEENYQDYYGERSVSQDESGSSKDDAPEELKTDMSYRWFDDTENAQPPEHYGWIVEVDPFDPESTPRKHTWLGRLRHENAAVTLSESGRVVVYTGHDQEDQRIYKFVSTGDFDSGDRETNFDLLTDGMLYVANFANGRWVPLDYENNSVFGDNGFASQADVLVRAPEAAALPLEAGSEDAIGTPLDRCEDIEVAPDGTVYAALTNNTKHGNFYGQVLRITEDGGDAEAEEFAFEVFATGGPQTGFASPDNLAFDPSGNLWIVTDISSSRLDKGIYETFRNNGAFVIPAGGSQDVFQFASGPVESELTGPFFTPDGSTLFLAVQHPGEETKDTNEPTSTWPDGDIPRPAVVAITGFA
jgi:secreted PhoX family phosphatase